MSLLTWLGLKNRDTRYGPSYYEIIFSKTGGLAHSLRINIFWVRRFLFVFFLFFLTSMGWLFYISYNHFMLQTEIAELEATKARMKQMAAERRKQEIEQEVIAGDYAKLAARLYDIEQKVLAIKARDQQKGKPSTTPMPTENNESLTGVGGEWNLENEDKGAAQEWLKRNGAEKFSHLEDWIEALNAVPRGMPVSPEQTRLSSPFGYRPNPFTGRGLELHNGLDFASKLGTPIYATAAGRVIAAGHMGGLGNAVKIDHGYGYMTNFGHMYKVLVREGSLVEAGDMIGLVGSTGRSSGPHLHYIVYFNGKPIDPITFVQ